MGLNAKNYMRDRNFSTKGCVVNLRPVRGTHWGHTLTKNILILMVVDHRSYMV